MRISYRLLVLLGGGLSLLSCGRDDSLLHPYSMAPVRPNASWTPIQKNTLISSRYCQTLIPSNIDSEELTLGELIDIALQNNPQTKITWSKARAAAANYASSLSSYMPEVDFRTNTDKERQTFFVGPSLPLTTYKLTTVTPQFTLSYTIFDFGQRRSTSESARQALYYADYMHNQQIQSTLQTVMDDYYDYTYQKNLLISYQADLENAEATLDAANQKLSSGVVSLGDVAQARSNLLNTKITIVSQRKTVEKSFARLAKDLGLPAHMEFKVKDLPEKIYAEPVLDNLEILITQAQKNRPDLLAAHSKVREYQANLDKKKASSRPKFTTDMNLGKKWYNQGVGWEDYHYSIQLNLTFPLFRGFYYKNQIKTAKARLEESSSELYDKELNVIKEVTTARYDVLTATETVKYSQELLQSAEVQFDIALKSYEAGTGTILDVLSAQSSLANARAKVSESKSGWYSSLAKLAYVTGTLCSPPEAEEKCID